MRGLKSKTVRRLSRAVFGRPGQGRNTRFVDRKKEAQRQACRGEAGKRPQGE